MSDTTAGQQKPFLDSYFGLTQNGTNVRTECLAGLTTFLTMAYIIFVNPQILGAAGMDFGAVLVATAGLGTLNVAALTAEALAARGIPLLGVVVGWRAGVRGDRVGCAARAHGQRVVHQNPARGGVPGSGEHVGARDIGAGRRHVDAERTQPERAGTTVEQVAERTRRVERRHAQPVDRSVRGDQGAGVAVRQERVVGDRGER